MREWQPLGLALRWLSGDEARSLEPLLAPDVCAAVYAPEESQIRAATLVQTFARSARNAGVRIYEHREVLGIFASGGRVMGVQLSQNETLSCTHLVLATGAWSASYKEWFHIAVPVTPLKGQMISLRPSSSSFLPRTLVLGEGIYIVPRDGTLLVGATKEETGFDTQVTQASTNWLHNSATRLMPTLRDAPIDAAWTGLRPRTPDTRPLLGAIPGWENATLAVGHNSIGVLLSAITGQTIAELVETGHTPDIIRPFSIERFEE
jgi:glycine oxidase